MGSCQCTALSFRHFWQLGHMWRSKTTTNFLLLGSFLIKFNMTMLLLQKCIYFLVVPLVAMILQFLLSRYFYIMNCGASNTLSHWTVLVVPNNGCGWPEQNTWTCVPTHLCCHHFWGWKGIHGGKKSASTFPRLVKGVSSRRQVVVYHSFFWPTTYRWRGRQNAKPICRCKLWIWFNLHSSCHSGFLWLTHATLPWETKPSSGRGQALVSLTRNPFGKFIVFRQLKNLVSCFWFFGPTIVLENRTQRPPVFDQRFLLLLDQSSVLWYHQSVTTNSTSTQGNQGLILPLMATVFDFVFVIVRQVSLTRSGKYFSRIETIFRCVFLFLWLVYHGHAWVLHTTEQIPFTKATLVAINLIHIDMRP